MVQETRSRTRTPPIMEPKYITLLQAAAIAILLAVVVVAYEPPIGNEAAQPELAVQR